MNFWNSQNPWLEGIFAPRGITEVVDVGFDEADPLAPEASETDTGTMRAGASETDTPLGFAAQTALTDDLATEIPYPF